MRVSWHQALFAIKNQFSATTSSISLWRVALLATAAAVGVPSQAEAALFYWGDSEPGYSRSSPAMQQPRRQNARRHTKKLETPAKESAKPQGPVIIAISIARQTLKVYDANGVFAETPISTGMPGHATPMGVFSVIQKHKLHHSNIYSGAPMPFMQRITWSGIAMHAGVLPGRPASHGCIRMPTSFAAKMWNWTRMGARVVVTPGEVTPASFSHPLLATQKVVPPQPMAAVEPNADAPVAPKSDKAANADAAAKPTTSTALELRSTVGHANATKPVMAETPAPTTLRDQTHTADARAAMPANASVTMSDAAPSGSNAPSAETVAVSGNVSNDVKSETAPVPAERAEILASDDKPAGAGSPQSSVAEAGAADQKLNETPALENETVKTAGESAKSDETKVETKAEIGNEGVKTETAKTDAAKPAEAVKESIAATSTVALPGVSDVKSDDAKKDQARLPDLENVVPAKPESVIATGPKRSGQIAVFVSRKDSKLYVRQNFSPLFDVPVKIAPSDRPLGTHVFTAQVDKDDANVLRWSVVSLPATARNADRRDDDERMSRRRKMAGAVEMKAPAPVPNSPAEALDRLTIPAEVMTRITEALATGGSIVVSDQGIGAGETGEGTDFIVPLR